MRPTKASPCPKDTLHIETRHARACEARETSKLSEARETSWSSEAREISWLREAREISWLSEAREISWLREAREISWLREARDPSSTFSILILRTKSENFLVSRDVSDFVEYSHPTLSTRFAVSTLF